MDSHDFTLFTYGGEEHPTHVGFPLPVILWDGGLHVFSSSKFEHGEAVAESNGNYYKINHHDGLVYKTDAEGNFTEDAKGHVTNAKPIDFSITKNIFMILVVGLILFMLFAGLGKSYKKNGSIAKGAGRFFEPIILYISHDIASSSLATEWIKGKKIDDAEKITNKEIAEELSLPPVKIHCSVLAEEAIKAAIEDYKKHKSNNA